MVCKGACYKKKFFKSIFFYFIKSDKLHLA